MTVLADSSPLITLARAEYLELLRDFYGEVTITREVHNEVVIAGAGLPGAEEVRKAEWIRVEAHLSTLVPGVEQPYPGLGAGERSTIHLAVTLGADLVLIDEGRARRIAKSNGLAVAGSIGILERGARLGKVPDLRSVYKKLVQQGIRFDPELLNRSLHRLGIDGGVS